MTAVLTSKGLDAQDAIRPDDVRDVLARNILADGLDFVLDIDRSAGSHLVDARTGDRYLDMFTFFASSALGMNHPALADDEGFRAELAQAGVNKPSNSDVYSVPMARFATPDDIALAIAFLADTTQSGFINGHTLTVDGGWTADGSWQSLRLRHR